MPAKLLNADELPSWATGNGHILVTGITGSDPEMGGKTAWCNWYADNAGPTFDLVLFLNMKGDSGVVGERVRSLDELSEGMRDGGTVFNFTPSSHHWEDVHEQVQRFVAALPKSMRKLVIHDESPEYGDADGSLGWFVRVAGNGANCKSILVAQHPTHLPTKIRNQCSTTVFVGPVTTDYRHWFRSASYADHFEDILQNQEPYWWTVMKGPREKDRTRYAPVDETYT